MVVYCTTNILNGKKYIGKDTKDNPNYLGSGKGLRNAIKKYGKENFKKQILARVNCKEFLKELEIYYIEYYNAVESTLFYNITKGGDGGKTHDQNHRKVKIYQFDLNRQLIKVWDSAIDAANILALGRARIVAECKDGGSYGYSLWSKLPSFKDKGVTHKFKKVLQIDKNTNEVIKEWDYLQKIEDTLKYSKANISKACKGKYITAYGYKWNFEERFEN